MRGIIHSEDFGWGNATRGGCGQSSGTNTVVQQSGPPPQVLANYQQVYNQAQGVAQQPYPTYNGSLIAGFTPQQQAGFNGVNQAVNAGYPFLNDAAQLATNSTNLLSPDNFQGTNQAYQDPRLAAYLGTAQGHIGSALGQSAAASGGLNAQNFGSTVGNYYSPYAQSVIAPTQALFNQQNATQLNQIRGNAAAQGAFGGDREAVAEGQAAQQQQLAEAPTLAGLETQGYQNATQNALAAAGLGQQTAGLTLQGAGASANLGNLQQQGYNAATGAAQGNAWLNSQGAFSLGNLGQEAQSMGLSGANALLSSGAQQQALQQQEMNLPYQQYLQAQQYPFQTTNWLEGLATGTGSLSGQQGSTTSPSPSSLSQIAGLGLTGTGILGATGAFGSSGWLSGLGASSAFDGPGTAVGAALADAAGAGAATDAGLGALGGGLLFARKGGRIDGDGHRAIQGLRGFYIPRRDSGGGVNPAMTAMFGGNPNLTNLYSVYANLPTEKLQELASRTPGNPIVTRALQMRQMAPQSDPAMQPQQQPGLGAPQLQGAQMQAAPGGFSSGGYVHRDAGGGLMDYSSLLNNDFGESTPMMGGVAPSALMAGPNTGFGGTVLGGGVGPMPDPGDIGQATPQVAGLAPAHPSAPHIRTTSEPISGMGAGTVPPQSVKTDDANINATEVQPEQGGQTAGLGAAHKDFMSGPWGTLLAAGLGIMSQRSPSAGANIGAGALQGLQFAQGERRMESQEALRQQQLQNSADYRKELVAGRSDALQQNTINRQAQLQMEQDRLKAQQQEHGDTLDFEKQKLNQLDNEAKYTWQSAMGPDPNDPTKQVSGLLRLPTTDKGQQQFFPGQSLTQKAPSGAAPTNAGSIGSDVHGDDYLKTLNPAEAAQIKALAEGRMQFPSGFALSKPEWQAKIAAVSQYDPNFDQVNYNARAKTRADFTSGQSAKNITSLNTVLGHLSALKDAGDSLNNTQYPWVNSVSNMVKTANGKAAVNNFQTDADAVADELEKSFRGTAGAVTGIRNWRDRLSSNASPEQMQGAWKELGTLLDSRIDSLGDQYSRGMGRTTDGLSLLAPHAQDAYSRVTGRQPVQSSFSETGQRSAPNSVSPDISQAAINALRQHPERAADFKAKYGVDPSLYLSPNG